MVMAKLTEIGIQLRREEYLFDAFFDNCCSERSFVDLKRIVKEDYESHGWGCYEKERD